MNTCTDCQYYEPGFSFCRRRAPTPAQGYDSATTEEATPGEALWPQVAADDWCGEFSYEPKRPGPVGVMSPVFILRRGTTTFTTGSAVQIHPDPPLTESQSAHFKALFPREGGADD